MNEKLQSRLEQSINEYSKFICRLAFLQTCKVLSCVKLTARLPTANYAARSTVARFALLT
jgi:hypothetical protein